MLEQPRLARHEIEEMLISEMNRTNEIYAKARIDFDAIVARYPGDLPEIGGAQMIRDCGDTLTAARHSFTNALIRYSDFVAKGTIPDHLKA
jgi:hypothetical protein